MASRFSTHLNVKIGKAVIEARVQPALNFYDRMFGLSQTLFEKHFDLWEAIQLQSTIKMWSSKHSYTFILKPDRCSLVWEFPDSLDKFQEISTSCLEHLTSVMDFQKILRLGLRIQTYVPSDMKAAEQVKLFHLQTHSGVLQNLNCFRDKVSDDAVFMNTLDDGFKIHYEIGPVSQAELANRLAITQKDMSTVKLPDPALWGDIDCAQTDVPKSELSTCIAKCLSKDVENLEEVLAFYTAKGK